jgi:hypothetical protein
MGELREQGEAPMGHQGVVRSFELEGQHRLSCHGLTLWVNRNVIAHPLYIRSQAAHKVVALFLPLC